MSETAVTKRLVIDHRQWGIADENALDVAKYVKEAMLTGSQVEVQVLDPDEAHPVTVFLNGTATASVEVDLLRGPRPSEMSKQPTDPRQPKPKP